MSEDHSFIYEEVSPLEEGLNLDLNLQLFSEAAVDQSNPDLSGLELQTSTSAQSDELISNNQPQNILPSNSPATQMITWDVHRCQKKAFLSDLRINTFKNLKRKDPLTLGLKINRKKCICAICQQMVKQKSVVHRLQCKHTFHQQCLHKWNKIKNACPLCRKELS